MKRIDHAKLHAMMPVFSLMTPEERRLAMLGCFVEDQQAKLPDRMSAAEVDIAELKRQLRMDGHGNSVG